MGNSTQAGDMQPTEASAGRIDADKLAGLVAAATKGPWRHEYMGGSSTVLSQAKPPRNDNRVPAYAYRDKDAEHCIAYPFNEDDGRVRQDFVCFSHGDAALIAYMRNHADDILNRINALEHWRQEVGKLHSQVDRLTAALAERDATIAAQTEAKLQLMDQVEAAREATENAYLEGFGHAAVEYRVVRSSAGLDPVLTKARASWKESSPRAWLAGKAVQE